MNVINLNLKFTSPLTKRQKTDLIVLHHSAGEGSLESVHAAHQRNGWAGCGYHFYIRKDGKIYVGRPLDKVGAHAKGSNEISVGICFEGNFEKENPAEIQLNSGLELLASLKKSFPYATVVRHSDLMATACPGKNFPFEMMKKGTPEKQVLESANDITWELKQKIEILDSDGFTAALDEAKKNNSPLYWGYYKIVNGG